MPPSTAWILELTLAPTDTTSLMFGISMLHTNVEDVPIGVDPQNPIYVDRDAPQSPDFTFNGTLTQDFRSILARSRCNSAATITTVTTPS